jgi:hypothetical protein
MKEISKMKKVGRSPTKVTFFDNCVYLKNRYNMPSSQSNGGEHENSQWIRVY